MRTQNKLSPVARILLFVLSGRHHRHWLPGLPVDSQAGAQDPAGIHLAAQPGFPPRMDDHPW